jgi:hypothetical protein
MEVSPTVSGSMLTPFSMLFAFMGVPAGFLLAKTKKYKWMYIPGYAILNGCHVHHVAFYRQYAPWLFVVITALVGFQLTASCRPSTLWSGSSPSPGACWVWLSARCSFFVMMGMAIAPAILGLAQNSAADLEAGLKLIFMVGAIGMAVSLLMVITIPEVSMDVEVADKQAPAKVAE